MVFIDWVSSPDHRNFNRAFFHAIRGTDFSCVVFSETLLITEAKCEIFPMASTRVGQALKVLKLVVRQSKKNIILLSYDPVFLPLISLFKRGVLVYEHNTTPAAGISKHLIWQKLFFGRVRRMAQFPAQYERLRSIGNNATYLGSPILPPEVSAKVKSVPSSPILFLAPSYRANISELERYSTLFNGATILAKNITGAMTAESQVVGGLNVHYLDRIEFCHNGRTVDAVIVTVQSRIRGTGWFNDSISNRTPIIIIDPDTQALFKETFPEYPFISLNCIKNSTQLKQRIDEVRRFDSMSYARSHNDRIRCRFLDISDQ